MVLKNKYKNYGDGLEKLNLDTLADRREKMSLKFAKDGIKNHTLTDILNKNRYLSVAAIKLELHAIY